jgi:hypothetical protein
MLNIVLFPTLISSMFRNPANMEIIFNENSKEYFIKFIAKELKDVFINYLFFFLSKLKNKK